MRRLCLIALMLFCVPIGRAKQADPQKIVGSWVQAPMPIPLNIRADGTYTIGLEDVGTWIHKGDQYLFNWEDGKEPGPMATGKLNSTGQLVLTLRSEDEDDAEKWVFHRPEVNREAKLTPLSDAALRGEWRYAYTRQSLYSFAATFETIIFHENAGLTTTNTLLGQTVKGSYVITGNKLKLKLGPNQMIQELTAELEDQGKMLILRPPTMRDSMFGETEWVMLRPEQFLSNEELIGTWIDPNMDLHVQGETEYRADGRFGRKVFEASTGKFLASNDPNAFKYYRIWNSPLGRVITSVSMEPMLGMTASTAIFERRNNELLLRELTCGMGRILTVDEDHVMTLTLKRTSN